MQNPGNRQGIPRYRRPGQLTADMPNLLVIRHSDDVSEPFVLGREIDSFDEGVDYIGTCQSCGAYWDVRQRTACPCGGYIG